ncbi:MAG: HU family DNA-binding protein [Pseudomonadota bacterium]
MTTTSKKTTTTKKTTARKTTSSTARKTAAPKAAPVVVDAPAPVVSGPVMNKKELIEAVVARSGIKKKDAKPTIEAMLDVLGEALAEGRELNLQPMGKIKVKRAKELANAKVMVTRVRQSKPGASAAPTPETAPEAAE